MSLTLYGSSRSRAFRVLWMLEEAGVPYHHDAISPRASAHDASYVAINPAGTVPCIVDDGFTMSESLAINLYLAHKTGQLWPGTERQQASALQWSVWAASTLEEPYAV